MEDGELVRSSISAAEDPADYDQQIAELRDLLPKSNDVRKLHSSYVCSVLLLVSRCNLHRRKILPPKQFLCL